MNIDSDKQPGLKTNENEKIRVFGLLFGLSLLVFMPEAKCFDTVWQGGIDNNWFEANNWSNGIPDTANNTIIVRSANSPIIDNITAQTRGTLTIAQGATLQLKSGSLMLHDVSALTGDHDEVINGTLKQTGGDQTIEGTQTINPRGQFILENGNLFTNRQVIDGVFVQKGGVVRGIGFMPDIYNVFLPINQATSVLNGTDVTVRNRYDLISGTFRSKVADIGSNGKNAVFNNIGGDHYARELNVGADNVSGAQGVYNLRNGRLTVEGNVTVGVISPGKFEQAGGIADLLHLTIGQKGVYNLASGNLNVGDPATLFNDDNLDIRGVFKQTGGNLFVRDILKINSGGTYNLAGGSVKIGDEDPSDDGLDIISGKFIQTGGSFTMGFHNKFDIRANGQYILEDGDLDTQGENIKGVFIQNGGNHNVYWHTNNPLSLLNPESFTMTVSNRYDLNGGTIRADNIDLGSNGTDGVFNHKGGISRIGNDLNIGADDSNPEIRGTYNLAGGALIAKNETIGFTSNGIFNQTGGVNSVNDSLNITQNGTYQLSGGELHAGTLTNNGDFIQTGGTISGNMTNNQRYMFSKGNLIGKLFNNGLLVFDTQESETFNANISGEGSLLKQNSGTINLMGTNSYLGGTTVSNGTLRGDTNSLQGDITNNATLAFNQANTGIFNGTITGSGKLIKENNGLLIFNNTNFYTGGTTINGGNLQVGDEDHPGAALPGPVTIGSGGMLSGHGTIIGDIQNNGALSPGGSIGTLSVLGNVSFNRGSTFNVEISPQQASLLNVSRNAALGGANVSVLADAGTYAPRSYTILNADTISGNFGNVSLTSATVNPSLDVLTPSVQVLRNQGNPTLGSRVNLNLDFIANPVGPVRPVIDKWLKTTLRTIGGRLNAPLGNACPKNSLGFWARGVGMISSADADGNAPGYDGGTAGTVLGFDGQFAENASFGLAGFYARSDVTVNQSVRQTSSADSLGLSVYGAYTTGAWQIKGVLGYDNDSYHSQRIGFGTNTSLLGNTHANHVNGYGEISYTFKSATVSIQPLVGLQLGWMRQKGFTESRANGSPGQALTIDGRTLYALDVLAGLRARQEFKINEKFQAQLEARLLYDHDFGTLQESVSGRINNRRIGPFNSSDRPEQRDAGIIGASFALLNADSLNFYLDYNGEFRSGQQAHFIGAGVRYSW